MIEPWLWAAVAVLLLALAAAVWRLGARLRSADPARFEQALREESRAGREEDARAARALREELAQAQRDTAGAALTALAEMSETQKRQLELVVQQTGQTGQAITQALEAVRQTLDRRLQQLQEGNEQRLEEMRRTVDEKLHQTLERRLGESFKLVSERLEAVQQGLGEMKTLAAGVGDLKRVLTNVSTRGAWGEIQLGAILEQILTPDQYGHDVRVRPDHAERVEYAVRLPGRGEGDAPVWLPIDSKFPKEDYERLVDATQAADTEAARVAAEALLRAIRRAARDISDKYIHPPETTDFAILFLPTEGLYAEVLRQPGLHDELQRQCRVLVTGPTTLSALLSSLRMGFRTLAIERRSSEVWQVLAAVKTEFGKFGETLERVKKQLAAASNTLDETGTRTRVMERKLSAVERLPDAEAASVLQLPPPGGGAAAP